MQIIATITNTKNKLAKKLNITNYTSKDQNKLYKFYNKHPNFTIKIKPKDTSH